MTIYNDSQDKRKKEQVKLSKALSVKQLTFANLIIDQENNKLSNYQCYKKAGYSVKNKKTAKAASSRLLKNINIRAYIDAHKAERSLTLSENFIQMIYVEYGSS